MFLNLIKREFTKFIFKQPKVLFFLFGAPLAYMLLFGILYQEDVVRYVPTIVYDQDQTPLSRALVTAFADSERFNIVGQVTSQEEMEEAFRQKQARTAVVIPPDFAQNVKKGLSTEVLVTAENTNMVLGNTVMLAAQEIIQDFSAKMGTKLLEGVGALPAQAAHKIAPIDFRLYVINNPTLSYSYFFLIGLVVTALQAGILLSMGYTITTEFTGERYQEVANIPTAMLLFVKCFVYFLLSLASLALAIMAMALVFYIPFKGKMFDVFCIGSAFIAGVLPLGVIMGAFCRDEVSYTQASLAIAMPSFIFSGYTWPLHAMNPLSLVLSTVFPVTYIVDATRDIMLAGYSPLVFKNSLALLVCSGMYFVIGGYFYARKRKREIDQREDLPAGKTELL